MTALVRRRWRRPSFEVTITIVLLALCAVYALTFSYMVWVSLEEQVFHPAAVLPRYAGRLHRHSTVEWVLLVGPAITGWIGVALSGTHLARRWPGSG